ncbi:hypothetical protein DERP_000724 [Dermatophagoides pteronyssinus]|uniref:Uncharacterized protein n=2 Tax=Dermatophagoides pteronyssinus TaxID=6956 RepID=A0ABQ8J0Y3_DERPT|nr:protein PFF0380w-like [Dermatophagoides pteronyssinus]KAH9416225.1 hypothetical protein DERP_000724 [Dermatophagoides pteronyssinus]
MDNINDIHEQSANMTTDNQIQISPKRQEAFIEFIRSMPRICSPTMFEISSTTSSYKRNSLLSPNVCLNNDDNDNDNQIDCQLDWSIEEYSAFYGKEFSNHHEQEEFDSLLNTTDLILNEFDAENRQFFSRDIIIPSPIGPVPAASSSSLDNNRFSDNENISRNTGSFIRWLDNIPFHSTGQSSSSNQQFFESAIVMNDISMKNETNDDHHTLGCEQQENAKNSFNNKTDSDFVSMSNNQDEQESMEISSINVYSSSAEGQTKLSFMETSMKCSPKTSKYRYDFGFNNSGVGCGNFSPMLFPIDDIGISPITMTRTTPTTTTTTIEMNKENISPIQQQINTVKKRPFLHHQFVSSGSSTVQFNHQQQQNQCQPLSSIMDSEKNIDDHFKTPQTTRIRRSRISRAKLFFTNEINAQSTPNNPNQQQQQQRLS